MWRQPLGKWVQVFFRTLNLPAFKCIPNMFESRQFQVVTTMNDVTDIFANWGNISVKFSVSLTHCDSCIWRQASMKQLSFSANTEMILRQREKEWASRLTSNPNPRTNKQTIVISKRTIGQFFINIGLLSQLVSYRWSTLNLVYFS